MPGKPATLPHGTSSFATPCMVSTINCARSPTTTSRQPTADVEIAVVRAPDTTPQPAPGVRASPRWNDEESSEPGRRSSECTYFIYLFTYSTYAARRVSKLCVKDGTSLRPWSSRKARGQQSSSSIFANRKYQTTACSVLSSVSFDQYCHTEASSRGIRSIHRGKLPQADRSTVTHSGSAINMNRVIQILSGLFAGLCRTCSSRQ